MLTEKESRCIEMLVAFVKESSDFRPVPMEEKTEGIFDFVEEKNILFLIKGSYKTRMLVCGVMIDHDVAEFHFNSNILFFYILSCNSDIAFSFHKEKSADRITKEIGLKIEIEVGNKEIDDHYLINSNYPDKLKKLIEKPEYEIFLKSETEIIEELSVKNGVLIFKKHFKTKNEDKEQIKTDIDKLTAIAETAEESI
ncbi:MAG: hypothetical protein LWY06_09700 [Firmicutes bacterium]|nr:hypothetical protein [Bacillota bacterium]